METLVKFRARAAIPSFPKAFGTADCIPSTTRNLPARRSEAKEGNPKPILFISFAGKNSTLMIGQITLVLFYVLAPLLILYLDNRSMFIHKIGAVVVAYVLGFVVGNLGILPEGSRETQELITMVTIPLAIPLLLFSSNIKQWLKLAGPTALSLLFGLLSVVVMVFVGFFVLHGQSFPELWKLGGMLVGVYTGGTPNLAALKIMLDIDADVYLLAHTYDMLISGVYFLFLITIGQRFFNLFLRPFKFGKIKHDSCSALHGMDAYSRILKKGKLLPLLKALGLSVLIFAIAGGVSLLVPEKSQMVVVILIITTLAIGGSMIPKINKIDKTFELGMYLILIFSLDVASMVDIDQLAGSTPVILSYLSLIVFGSLFLQSILSKIFKIDTDTMIITSTALICSPPFVPVVAGAMNNREIVVSGLTVGIVGYAIGNYLGFVVAQVLSSVHP